MQATHLHATFVWEHGPEGFTLLVQRLELALKVAHDPKGVDFLLCVDAVRFWCLGLLPETNKSQTGRQSAEKGCGKRLALQSAILCVRVCACVCDQKPTV